MADDDRRPNKQPFTTRIITYAWGEQYIDELLGITIPAALSPNNLPYVAASAPCELVILTEERLFDRVRRHPSIIQAMTFCPLRLIGIDDLIVSRDKYGMTLTHALHRGFADLGAAMTDSWLIFLNADFIIADGSLRTVVERLRRGDRVVASPSYCVASADVKPALTARIDPKTSTMSILPREMAEIAITHRHNTIRGKTINENSFHIRLMDQFYWRVDDSTILGHQMPIAIVGMRPQQYVSAPASYWDYGVIRDYCPSAEFSIIGDSDEFLMIELREKDVAKDQIMQHWPTAAEIASYMMVFITDYQLGFAKYPLTLHSKDLPATIDTGRQKLREFVDHTLSWLPGIPPTHYKHLQWEYHEPRFIEGRHEKLSARLGFATEFMQPPDFLDDADRLWWQYDGLKKKHNRETVAIELERRHEINNAYRNAFILSAFKNGGFAAKTHDHQPQKDQAKFSERGLCYANILESKILNRNGDHVLDSNTEAEPLSKRLPHEKLIGSHTKDIDAAIEEIERTAKQRNETLEKRMKPDLLRLEKEYSRLTAMRTPTALNPYLRRNDIVWAQPAVQKIDSFRKLAKAIYGRIFGFFPFVTPLNPLWAPSHQLRNIVNECRPQTPFNGAVIAAPKSNIHLLLKGSSGVQIGIPSNALEASNLRDTFNHLPEFDFCLFELANLEDFVEYLDFVRGRMRAGGTILGYYIISHEDRKIVTKSLADRLSDLKARTGEFEITYGGSRFGNWVINRFYGAARRALGGTALSVTFFIVQLALLQPAVWMANLIETLGSEKTSKEMGTACRSLILKLNISRQMDRPARTER